MTAREFISNGKVRYHQDEPTVSIEELVEWLEEFALLKCAEQRDICAEEADLDGDEGDRLWIDKDSIINSPNPEM